MLSSQSSFKEQFFQSTVETISNVLQLPTAIWLVDEAGKDLRIEAATKILNDYAHNAYLRLNEPSIASNVFRAKETVVVADIQSENEWKYKAEAHKMGLKAAIVAPLKIKHKVVGVLDIYIPEHKEFDYEKNKPLIENFTQQIAITFRQNRSIETLGEVGTLISSELQDPDRLMQSIMQAEQKVLDCKYVSIFLIDEQSGDLILKATSRAGLRRTRFRRGEGLAGLVAQKNRILLVTDVRNHPEFVRGMTSPEIEDRSLLLAPIQLEEQVVGVISANMDGLNGFDEYDITLIKTLASQSAVAIRNANLFGQLRNHALAQTELHRLGQQLVSIPQKTTDTSKLLNNIAESAKNVLSADLIELYEYFQDKKEFKLPQIAIGEKRNPEIQKNKIYDDDTVLKLIKISEPVYKEKVGIEDDFTASYKIARKGRPTKRFVEREQIISSAVIPLRTGDEKVGLMFANYRKPQYFTSEQRELIELFANQAAIAIKNTRFVQQVHSQAQTFKELNQISQSLISIEKAWNTYNLLQEIADRAKEVLNADLVEFYEYHQDENRYELPQIAAGERLNKSVKKVKIYPDDSVWQLIQRKEPLYEEKAQKNLTLTSSYSEPRQDMPESRFVVREQIQSIAVIPLKAGEEKMGLMFANYRTVQAFTKGHRELLELFAKMAAIAIRNARVYNRIFEANQRKYEVNKRRKSLVDFGKQLTLKALQGEKEILNLIPEYAAKFMETDNMYIALYDRNEDRVSFPIFFEKGIKSSQETRPAGKGRTEEIIRSGKHIFIATGEESRRWYKEPGREEYRGKTYASWMGVPMIDVNNNVVGVIATYHPTDDYIYSMDDLEILQSMADLTAIALENAQLYDETKQLRDERIAREQLATLGAAMATLQHRISNTFEIINPNLSSLKLRIDMDNQEIKEIIDIIERNARTTSEVIARIQEPLRELEEQTVDIHAVIEDGVKKAKDKWQGRSIKIEMELDDSIPFIRAPIGQVSEVFGNLVDNAFRAMQKTKKDGVLTIKSFIEADNICVRIQDTGTGIPPDIQSRIFIKPVSSKETTGTAGLGLWLSALILKKIGGLIKMEKSTATGTAILVQIPLQNAVTGGVR